jgi:DnaJ-class molecular chaperone with C-terminal Zn finger domain
LSETEALRSAALASLGLGPEAGEDEIRTAYRRLAMRYHPDASGDPATAKRFAKVVRAYKVLTAYEGPRAAGSQAPRPRRYRAVDEAGGDIFALGQLLASEDDLGARAAAVAALGLSGRSAAFVFLRRALYDPSEEVALAAVRASALLGSRQAEGEIAALYARSSGRLRRGILEVASATGERLFRSTLEVASRDEDQGLREMAARIRTTV